MSNPKLDMSVERQKAKAVLDYLLVPEHAELSNREIGRRLGIHESYVRRARAAFPYGVTTLLPIDSIRLDGGTQPRAEMKEATIAEYEEAFKGGAKFPPVVVFYDGTDHWCGDGFQRITAAKRAGLTEIDADVRMGEKRDAILFSVGANSDHGDRRTNADKRRAVETLLRDEEWKEWSNRVIAEKCRVSDRFVGLVKAESGANRSHLGNKKRGKDGKDYPSGKASTPSSNGTATVGSSTTDSGGQSLVNGVLVADPPDVAKARAEGRIAPGVVPDVDDPGETTSVDDVREEIEERKAKTEDDLSDEEWLSTLPLWHDPAISRKKLGTEALLYRRMAAARRKWKYAIEEACRGLPGADRTAYYWRYTTPLRADDPTRLVKCASPENGGCGGTGASPITGECEKCYGRGYRING